MKVLNDFYCTFCGTTMYDQLLDNGIVTVDCLNCHKPANKVQHIPKFVLPGNDAAGFPTAHDKWVKNREQKNCIRNKSRQFLNGPEI
jgi:hypothetical protein